MRKRIILIIVIVFSSLIFVNCSVSCVEFSISYIKSNIMYENNEKIKNKKIEMVNNDYNKMKNCFFEYEVIPIDEDNKSIYIQNFDDYFIGKPYTVLGNREVEKRNFLMGTIKYSIKVYGSQLMFDYYYEYDFYSNVKSNFFGFSIDDSDTSYFEKSEFEIFNDFFNVINEYFEWDYDFVDMLYTNQNIKFTGENFDLNKYKSDEISSAVAYEYSFDIDANNELSITYKAYQENGKSDYRKVFSISVYQKMGDE